MSALAIHVRRVATDQLKADGKEATEEAVEQQGRWLLALWHAQNAHDLNEREMAELFLDGVQPVKSIEEECKDLTNPDDEDWGQDVIDFIDNL